ncbi:hypothetical protein HJG54_16515 [Leptolyngbya sp. NK1-12]|uniref:DUF2808 domain-containing protein n=1 Tax=Leptolyngbya sp. NK1-12 TaxID=2547451 RepID=A0AA97AL61_9CYAN|nr:hypothetical protein [Leptolyngbya sp. NK1-12]WNZ24302.1 hypothetical protein HJG54_16515 [Leptolyngbya sp. NK1-12]
MNWRRFTATSLLLASATLPFLIAGQAQANRPRTSTGSGCFVVTSLDTGERRFVTATGLPCNPNSTRSTLHSTAVAQVTPVVRPVAEAWIDPNDHNFELFNNSDRDILYLHLFPVSTPDDVAVLGGRRGLAPGRAWNVNLDRGCEYNLLVEFEDGAEDFYEGVDTCAYRGIQLR